ncbi:MAG: PfkB family carbohydrate kinase [Victivallaceae bacterium]|nr:PfkB family carbohydrate kinase [Victivallaceae bacterium]
MMRNFDFVALGHCDMDYIALIPVLTPDGKTEMIEQLEQGGGPAATAAVAAARLGGAAAFIGAVGDDEPGRRLLAGFRDENVDVSAVAVRPGASSAVAYCWIERDSGRRTIAWRRGTCRQPSGAELPEEMIASAKVLHLDSYDPAPAEQAARIAAGNGVLISLDADNPDSTSPELLAAADILIASRVFALKVTGCDNPEAALDRLAGFGRAAVVGVTLGDGGAIVRRNGRTSAAPAFKVDVRDTTGAGDVFHAAFALRFSETGDEVESLRFASGAAALKCRGLGGRTAIPSRIELDEFLRGNPAVLFEPATHMENNKCH